MTTTTLSAQAIIGILLLAFALGGVAVASTLNIWNAKLPREKRFLLWVTLLLWLLLIGFLAMVYFLPSPWRFVMLGCFFLLAPILIYRVSLRRQLIREYEMRIMSDRDDAPPSP